MNEDENLFPPEFDRIEADLDSSFCSIGAEKLLDVYLGEQINEEFENHLIYCSSCQEKLGLCHQFVTQFGEALKFQPRESLKAEHTANGGNYEKTKVLFEC